MTVDEICRLLAALIVLGLVIKELVTFDWRYLHAKDR